MNDKAETVKLF